ncbi:hypothetical protein ACFL3E_01300 [Patescibacteria group bacterium]
MNYSYFRQQLASIIEKGQVGHAFLFVGADSSERSALIDDFVNSLLCKKRPKSKDLSFCNVCKICAVFKKNPLFLINRIGFDSEGDIGIKDIRNFRARALKTTDQAKKIFLIFKAERMTQEASAAILKILEEPPEDTIFIFITSSENLIHHTLRSRMNIIRLPQTSESADQHQRLKETKQILFNPLHERIEKAGVLADSKDGARIFLEDSITVLTKHLDECVQKEEDEVTVKRAGEYLQASCHALFLLNSSNVTPKLLLETFFVSF